LPLPQPQLVSALNPHATERLEEDLLIEIGTLQSALDEAASDAASAEAALRASLADLTELEAKAAALSSVAGFARAAVASAAAAASSAAVESDQQRAAEERRRQTSATSSSPSSSLSPAAAASPAVSLAAAGLSASLDLSPRLREFWHPVAFSRDVKKGGKGSEEGVAFDLFDAGWVLRRDAETGAPLCVSARSSPSPPASSPSASTWPDAPASLPAREQDGLVWAWPGSGPPPGSLPAFAAPPEGYTVHAELTMAVPVDAALLLENLLDLAHAPFTHTGTFARGWPVPDAVTFRAREALGGAWDPYPIDMCYAPPAATLSLIAMRAPGAVARSEKTPTSSPPSSSTSAASSPAAASAASSRHLHQMHVVLPAGPGRVRLLYRMCLDFWPWASKIPLVAELWRTVADRVMSEDLVLVAGQQDRLLRGGSVWANPVPYDKLGVRCRRWRNAVAAGDERAARLAMPEEGAGFMSARELLFATEDD
jgi:chlorophyllide a oxygenase